MHSHTAHVQTTQDIFKIYLKAFTLLPCVKYGNVLPRSSLRYGLKCNFSKFMTLKCQSHSSKQIVASDSLTLKHNNLFYTNYFSRLYLFAGKVGVNAACNIDSTLDLCTRQRLQMGGPRQSGAQSLHDTSTHYQCWESNPRPSDLESNALFTWPCH